MALPWCNTLSSGIISLELCLLLINLHSHVAFSADLFAGKSFYEILDVQKDASLQEIRKGFKKLALIHHPDKNKDDPDAESKFRRLSRAYEVLKDEELRKKYDSYGEDGVKEGSQSQPFQSWTFYKEEFGIYDDDPEIVTLSGSDFEQLVLSGGQRWFINFYSARCSHCHHVAPDWRKMAREVEGAFRIGAVNCLDDYMICNQQNMRSYPSLVVYPERIHYQGPRDAQSLVDFILQQLNPGLVFDLNLNRDLLSDDSSDLNRSKKPYLIELVRDGQEFDAISDSKRKILAASLENLVNFAFLNCAPNQPNHPLCDELAFSQKLIFFPAGPVHKSTGVPLHSSLDIKEIVKNVLELLPDFTELTDSTFRKVRSEIIKGRDSPWLIEFVDSGSSDNLDLRKLPALLSDAKVGRLNCSKFRQLCQEELKIHKYPTFAVLKKSGGFEINYGRNTAYDLASFVRDCAHTNMQSLGPDLFPQQVVYGDNAWFVDFFAPWCPPCMKLLPEFRKAARFIGDQVNFGTIDCTVYQHICRSFNVHSYPTTIFYNMTKPHVLVGYHSSNELVDFVEDMKNPPVISLNEENFGDSVLKRKKSQMWIIDFFNPHCYPCQQLAPEFRKLAKLMSDYEQIRFGQVDCLQFETLCRRQHIQAYPTIRLYPIDKQGYTDYQNWHRDAQSIRQWIHQWFPSEVEEINGHRFLNDVLLSSQPHLVDFYAPWCGHCNAFAPEYEKVARALKSRVKVVKINCDLHPTACSSAGIRSYPTVRWYAGVKSNSVKSAAGVDLYSQSSKDIIDFVERILKPIDQQAINRDEL